MTSALACETLLSLCVQVGIVILATAAIERRMRNAQTACQLWTLSFVAILGLIATAMFLPHPRWVKLPEVLHGDAVLRVVAWQTSFLNGFVVIWGVGFLFLIVNRCFRWIRLRRFLTHDCRSMSREEIASLPHLDIATSMDVRWLVSEALQGPFCCQLHHPTVVLPQYALDEDRTTLRHLLTHELEHLRTSHPLQHFLQGLCGAVLWFHPAAWWARRRAELAREYACDEVAATTEGTIAAYLRTLAKVAERNCNAMERGLAFGRGKSAVLQRGRRLIELAERPAAHSSAQSAAALFALLLIVAAVSQLWLPVNLLASSRSRWSPWPHWTANALHDFGISVRDFERFDERHGLHELRELQR